MNTSPLRVVRAHSPTDFMSYVRSATSGGPQTGHVDIGFRLRRLSRPKSQVALSPFASAEGTHLYPSLWLPFLVAAGFFVTPARFAIVFLVGG